MFPFTSIGGKPSKIQSIKEVIPYHLSRVTLMHWEFAITEDGT